MTLMDRLTARARDPKTATDAGGERLSASSQPATEEQVQAAEARLRTALPPLLRRLYLEIGDGGFGPGMGLPALARLERVENAPKGLLRLCEWGSGIASVVDCTQPEVPVLRLDPNMPKRDEAARVPAQRRYAKASQVPQSCWVESPALEAWLEAWADGKPLFYLGYGEPEDDTDEDDLDEDEED